MTTSGCAASQSNVLCTLNVETLQGRSRFTLLVSNNLQSEVILQFSTSQQYDFIVKSRDGKIAWQWSRGMMFAQMLTSLTLAPNEEKIFTEECSLPQGEYIAQGILTTMPKKIYTEWIEFTVTQSQMPVLRGKITRILNNLYLLGEDGTAYLIVNPSKELVRLQGKTIEVTSYRTESIPGTVDKRIIIKKYNK
jgi:hypothetical protein